MFFAFWIHFIPPYVYVCKWKAVLYRLYSWSFWNVAPELQDWLPLTILSCSAHGQGKYFLLVFMRCCSWSYLACPWSVLRSLGCDINICDCLEGRKHHIASVLQRETLNHHRADLWMYCNTVKNCNLLLYRARWVITKADSYYSGDRHFDDSIFEAFSDWFPFSDAF